MRRPRPGERRADIYVDIVTGRIKAGSFLVPLFPGSFQYRLAIRGDEKTDSAVVVLLRAGRQGWARYHGACKARVK